ncbi:lipoyl(octanoyl) transferase [Alicyclobacillaceae bacterium I2511]|jgi:lipoyl(octanoyl) transferase|nr:lipoyl(octanoyl) transferase [Alicyclobacillaceae bacterium I2511]
MTENDKNVVASWHSIGWIAYADALNIQQQQATRVLTGTSDSQSVFAVEHPPTLTIGRNGTRDHILLPEAQLTQKGFSVYEVDRGGDVTYHGPGQWVIYPVLHLGPWGNDVGLYVRLLEESVIQSLKTVSIAGKRMSGYPGVWVGDSKICAIGARVRRRTNGEFVTSHGIALNVNVNLAHFSTIIPCGIADKTVTSVQQLLGEPVNFGIWEMRLQKSFSEVFGLNFDEFSDGNTWTQKTLEGIPLRQELEGEDTLEPKGPTGPMGA